LHSLLSECTYTNLSGTNVYWDFVELPSQIMENWIKEKESLDLFAHHYQTGEAIPQAFIDSIQKASKFQTGWFSMRQLRFGYLDMAWHSQDTRQVSDVIAFEEKAVEKTNLLPTPKDSSVSCAFSHIFAGGYSAGYYSYKWAEVLDADAFEYFKEKGLFNREVAESFKKNVLSRGGTEHPMELYKKFRGREPDINALLKRDGLVEA
jgi:peptidyl-dipeptidase Dcp